MSGHHEGIDYLVMEFLAGETMREQLDRGRFQPDEVLRYGTQIADALAEAHRRGVIHGDLKPGNVMVTANGAKVLDFGAREIADPKREEVNPPSHRSPFSSQGGGATLPYMAPEQREGHSSDARSDIFSFGYPQADYFIVRGQEGEIDTAHG